VQDPQAAWNADIPIKLWRIQYDRIQLMRDALRKVSSLLSRPGTGALILVLQLSRCCLQQSKVKEAASADAAQRHLQSMEDVFRRFIKERVTFYELLVGKIEVGGQLVSGTRTQSRFA
jgi:hypothetical protein